jgi:hypothetical protein
MTYPAQSAGFFTPGELARLRTFRVAVVAGLYTDGDGAGDVAYRFTAAELERLMVYRLAVEAGYYTDELDARSDTTNTRVGA